MPIDSVRLGLSGGILTGIFMFVTTLIALATEYGAEYLEHFVRLYPGFHVTVGGSLLGLVYGFITGFVGFFLLAWLYNLLGPLQEDEENSADL